MKALSRQTNRNGLPPAGNRGQLIYELRFVAQIDREDAIQEAWLAFLEGRNPARAVNTFAQRERRRRQKLVPLVN